MRSSFVFGNIAGVIAEQGEPDEAGRLLAINPHRPREAGHLQDMYRITLAASWTACGNQLPPDTLIEDIFSGGIGGSPLRSSGDDASIAAGAADDDSSVSDSGARTVRGRHAIAPGEKNSRRAFRRNVHPNSRSEFENSDNLSAQQTYGDVTGVSEFDVREDLRSWEISTH